MIHPPRFGVGFRTPHFATIAAAPQPVDWFEIVTESFLGVGGPRRAMLARLRAEYPIILHGVGLSIAGAESLSAAYLAGVRDLADWLEAPWVSDHLCWTGRHGRTSHDLLPVAYTRDVLDHVAGRVAQVQDVLQRRLLLENPSAYVAFRDADMDEAEFFAALCARSGCGMLLDVNNLYVNAANLGVDPGRYLAAIPADHVAYVHVAGHAVLPDVRIDTHDEDVPAAVWSLFEAAVRRCPTAGVIIERDDNLPPFGELLAEVAEARTRHAAALAAAGAHLTAARTGAPAQSPPPYETVDEWTRSGGAVASPFEKGGLRGIRPDDPFGKSPLTPLFQRGGPILPRQSTVAHGGGRGEVAVSWELRQQAFWEQVVDKPVGFDHVAALARGGWLADGVPVAAARGMRVYSDAYSANLRRALAVNFPALARVVSPADFEALAAAYVRVHPPCGHDFRELGAHLAAFVRTFPFGDSYGVDREVLADLVAVEQAQIEVLDAIDTVPGVSADDLAHLDAAQWEAARFRFVPALRLVPVTSDVLPVIETVGCGEPPARPAAMAGAYLVSRDGATLRTERLRSHEAACLGALLGGHPFAEACERAAADATADAAAVATDAVRLLVTACRRGMVRAVFFDEVLAVAREVCDK